MNLENIPEELKKLKQWVFWKNVNGVKVPLRTSFHSAKTNDPDTWISFGEASLYRGYGMTGIGFVLTAEDPFTIIDLDKCIGNGLAGLTSGSFCMQVSEYFKSYTEISPSGTGIHIVVKGKIPEAIKRSEIEIYSEKRYMAFTGDLVWNFPIRECQKELGQVYKKYKPKPRPRKNYPDNDDNKFEMPVNITIPEGNRNNELARWAGIISNKVNDVNEYFDLVCEINSKFCYPPLPEREVRNMAKSIWRY